MEIDEAGTLGYWLLLLAPQTQMHLVGCSELKGIQWAETQRTAAEDKHTRPENEPGLPQP